ncbi:MAG TPA: hypothetical protein DD490_06645 [Acidobacteria bacterium]|nr:hypothetical protein [Acidobacteriota bacterium]
MEYSYGGFGEIEGFTDPMLLPPMVKIYQDGRIVFIDDRGIWQGRVQERRLARLKAYLAKQPLLKETGLIRVQKGEPPGLHGGMAYIKYLDGEHQVVIGSLLLPTAGPWHRIVEEIRSVIPSSSSSFIPESVTVFVFPGGRWGSPVQWPAPYIPLAPSAAEDGGELTVSDREVASFILQHASVGFSWLQCVVLDGGQTYSLHIKSVPGWYQPEELERVLGGLAAEVLERERLDREFYQSLMKVKAPTQ